MCINTTVTLRAQEFNIFDATDLKVHDEITEWSTHLPEIIYDTLAQEGEFLDKTEIQRQFSNYSDGYTIEIA